MCTLEQASFVATIAGAILVPLTIVFYIIDKRMEREKGVQEQLEDKERKELETYNNLSTEWREYLKLCLQHPELDIANKNAKINTAQDEETIGKRKIMYEILISMFESAYMQYKTHSSDVKNQQWHGWEKYLDDWLGNHGFVAYCNIIINGEYYSKDFLDYLDERIKKLK
jgi:hypothetical protein